MADAPSSLTYVLDENTGGLLNVLRLSRAFRFQQVRSMEELGIPKGTLDPALLLDLGRRGPHALVTRDSSMLDPLLQRGAWREAGVTLFMLGKGWGKLPLSELSRRLLFLWPDMVAQAEAIAVGAAWRVSPTLPAVPSGAFRLVTGRDAGG